MEAGLKAREIRKGNVQSIQLFFCLVLGTSAVVRLSGLELQMCGHGRDGASFCHGNGQKICKTESMHKISLPKYVTLRLDWTILSFYELFCPQTSIFPVICPKYCMKTSVNSPSLPCSWKTIKKMQVSPQSRAAGLAFIFHWLVYNAYCCILPSF